MLNKKLYLSFSFLLNTFLSMHCSATEHHVHDSEITAAFLNNPEKVDYRASSRYLDNLVFRQFIDLHISGSSQYTEKQFSQILENIVENNNFQDDVVLIIDLRGESHLFVTYQLQDNKGNPLSISAEPFTIVDKKNREILHSSEKKLIDSIQGLSITVVPHRFATDFEAVDGEVQTRQPFTITASREGLGKIETEEEMVNRVAKLIQIQPKTDLYANRSGVKVEYFRLPVPDLSVPTSEQIDTFISHVKNIEKKYPDKRVWLHIHCHGGLGRTAFFMNVAAMMRSNKTLLEIENRQIKSGGRALLDIEHPEIGQSLQAAKGVRDAIKAAYEKIRKSKDAS